jgi:hypothetical protein
VLQLYPGVVQLQVRTKKQNAQNSNNFHSCRFHMYTFTKTTLNQSLNSQNNQIKNHICKICLLTQPKNNDLHPSRLVVAM